MTAIERRQRKAYISELRHELARISEGWRDTNLHNPAIGTQRGVVTDKDGNPLAKFREESDRYFFAKVVNVIEALADTIEELQEELRDARAERRSYAVLTNHLQKAGLAGLNTTEGRRRVKDAIEEAKDPTPNKEWDW